MKWERPRPRRFHVRLGRCINMQHAEDMQQISFQFPCGFAAAFLCYFLWGIFIKRCQIVIQHGVSAGMTIESG
jgi:uncharacterized protein with PQ loop repeat